MGSQNVQRVESVVWAEIIGNVLAPASRKHEIACALGVLPSAVACFQNGRGLRLDIEPIIEEQTRGRELANHRDHPVSWRSLTPRGVSSTAPLALTSVNPRD